MTDRASTLKADGVLLALSAFWGAMFVVVQEGLVDADAWTFLCLRFLVGAVAATALARTRALTRSAVSGGLVLAPFLFGGFAFQTFGLTYTTASRSAFITGLTVALVPFAAMALLKRRAGLFAWIGVATAVAGLAILTGGLSGPSAANALGDVLTFGCAVAFALHITLTEKFSVGRSAVGMVAVQLWGVAVLCLAGWVFSPHRFELSARLVGAVLCCGVLASAVAVSLQTWAQARTTAVRAALIFCLEPVFATALSVALGRERLSRQELVGGGLIVSGVVIAEMGALLLRRFRRQGAAQLTATAR